MAPLLHVIQVGVKMEGRPGHVHQAQGTYDPITNEWLHAPAGTVAQTAGDRSRQDEHNWAVNKTGACLRRTETTKLSSSRPLPLVAWSIDIAVAVIFLKPSAYATLLS